MFKKNTWLCDCITCYETDRQNRARRKVLFSIIGAFLIVAIIAFAVSAQTLGNSNGYVPGPNDPNPPTICLFHPSTLMKIDPAGRVHLIQARVYTWPQFVPAIPYIRQEWVSTIQYRKMEAISAAVQYSIGLSAQKLADSQRVMIGDYLLDKDQTNIPKVSLHEVVRQYIWSQNAAVRSWASYWLIQVIESPGNVDCNPWRNYGMNQ